MAELMKCPFCHVEPGKIGPVLRTSPPEVVDHWYWVLCAGCGSEGPMSDAAHKAIAIWNEVSGAVHQ